MKKAFTSLELLICIAIISILIAILFPIFNKIKIQSYNITSISNIKHLGYAWKMYCEDYDDVLMRHLDSTEHWFGNGKTSILDPYVKLKNIKDPLASKVINAPNYWIGYGYNGFYLSPDEEADNFQTVKYSNISNPANTVVFTTVAGLFFVNKKEGLYPVSLIYPPSTGFATFHARYNGKSPVLWADLHATNKKPIFYNKNKSYSNFEIGFIDSDSNQNTDELFDLD
jgi:prepilin-type N-terminal cleavage/methylation domain-containing protein